MTDLLSSSPPPLGKLRYRKCIDRKTPITHN